MKVKCEYCKSWMDDGDINCPNCGALNSILSNRTDKNADKSSDKPEKILTKSSGEASKKKISSPKTIEELKQWYSDRGLPPYETTRFFIGINYEKPKAFGIYKDGDEFVVYKNKADGKRAVRYRGTDEAYAVNELYLRLKEEIINQKNNSKKLSKKAAKKKKRRETLVTALICLAVSVGIPMGVYCGSEYAEKITPHGYRYYLADSGMYFLWYDSEFDESKEDYVTYYEWWNFDDNTQDWVMTVRGKRKRYFPDGVTNENLVGDLYDLAGRLNIEYEDRQELQKSPYNIYRSHTYIDAHHNNPSRDEYYIVNDVTYYYLNDRYGGIYTEENNAGWYKYTDDGWEYYTDGNDHSVLGDELWYDSEDYWAGDTYSDYVSGSVYSFTDEEADGWVQASEFEDTEWYEEYEEANTAQQEYFETHSDSSSDSDSDYNWSSSDSWDSSATDWDSDW